MDKQATQRHYAALLAEAAYLADVDAGIADQDQPANAMDLGETDPVLYHVADLDALLAAPISHVGPTELSWQPVRYGSRMGTLRDLSDGESLGVMTLAEAGRACLEHPIRVRHQHLTCGYHPVWCGLDTIRCVPVEVRRRTPMA